MKPYKSILKEQVSGEAIPLWSDGAGNAIYKVYNLAGEFMDEMGRYSLQVTYRNGLDSQFVTPNPNAEGGVGWERPEAVYSGISVKVMNIFKRMKLQPYVPTVNLDESKVRNAKKEKIQILREAAINAGEIMKAFKNAGITDEQAKEISEMLNGNVKYDEANDVLEKISGMINGFGVEAVTHEDAHVDSYFRDAIALYINMGDTYDTTVVYDTENGDFLITSWGDFYEGWEEENVQPEPNWESLKKGIRPWRIFEDVRESMSVKEFIEGIRDDFMELQDYNMDYISDVAYEGAEALLSDEGYDDIGEIRDKYPDEFQELVFAVEEAGQFNVDAFFNGMRLFVYDDTIESQGIYGDEESEADDKEKFSKEAKKYGFSDKDIAEVWDNATYGGVGGVGIIIDAEDLWKEWGQGSNVTLNGDAILYIRDSVNGSGHYVLGKKSKKITVPKAKVLDRIDYGSYSLGDVFGTNDWNW